MENASKALIIAGAILLSIILISLGIMVVNNARNAISGSDLSDTQIQTFNSKFSSYVGNNKTADQVYNLIEAVQTSNMTENRSGEKRYVQVNIVANASVGIDAATYGADPAANSAPVTKTITKLPSSSSYKVEILKGTSGTETGYLNGLIAYIRVTKI